MARPTSKLINKSTKAIAIKQKYGLLAKNDKANKWAKNVEFFISSLVKK